MTDYALRIEERLWGKAPDRVSITVPGGSLGNLSDETCVTVSLETGARYLLFCACTGRADLWTEREKSQARSVYIKVTITREEVRQPHSALSHPQSFAVVPPTSIPLSSSLERMTHAIARNRS